MLQTVEFGRIRVCQRGSCISFSYNDGLVGEHVQTYSGTPGDDPAPHGPRVNTSGSRRFYLGTGPPHGQPRSLFH